MLGIRADRVQHGVSLSTLSDVGINALTANLHRGLDTMEAIRKPVVLSITIQNHRRERL